MRVAVVSLAPVLAFVSLGCESEPRPPRPGETCWGQELAEAQGAEFCEPQQCFKKDHSFAADTASGPGFSCSIPAGSDPCKAWVPGSPGAGSGQAFSYLDSSNGWRADLSFNRMLMADGYSLENFRKYVEMAVVSFPVDPEFDAFSAYVADLSKVEFVSYDNGIVHVRFVAKAVRTYNVIPTPIYICGPQTCDHKTCFYGSEDAEGSGESVEATVDIKAPLEQMI